MIRRTPIPKVSKKRQSANRIYTKLRKEFLAAHPYCQWFIEENGLMEERVIANGGRDKGIEVPMATEIHHKKKPKATYLNVIDTWMAVSQRGHHWIEVNKGLARQKGYLENI